MDISSLIKRALSILYLKNPISTTMGVLLGGTLYGVISEIYNNFKMNCIYYITGCVFLFNIPTYLKYRKLDKITPEKVHNAFFIIEKAKNDLHISKQQSNKLIRELLEIICSEELNKEVIHTDNSISN
jgi:predicted butyrate kinase (DUF1464 family)